MNEKIMKFKGTIDSVEVVKTGVSSSGRPWELIKVVAGGVSYTTFDNKYKGLIGQEVEFDYKEEQRGEYTNLTIVTHRPQDILSQNVQGKLDIIDKKLDTLIARGETDLIPPPADQPMVDPADFGEDI